VTRASAAALTRSISVRLTPAWERLALWGTLFGGQVDDIAVQSAPTEATIVALGDICLVTKVESATLERGPEVVVGGLRELIAEYDLRIANLESVLSSGAAPRGRLGGRLRAHPQTVSVLTHLGIGGVTVANNHCVDFGADGLEESLDTLGRAGITHCGTLRAGRAAQEPASFAVRGLRVGMLGYCDDYRTPASEHDSIAPAESRDDRVLADIRLLRDRFDILIVQMHWGYEFQLYPLLPHRDRARRFVEAGADVVLCHHAHVPMGLEVHGRGVIAHGLGNCIFPPSEYMRSGHPFWNRSFVLRIGLGRAGVTSVTPIPIVIQSDASVHRARGLERRRVLAVVARGSRGLADSDRLRRLWRDRTAREAVEIRAAATALIDNAEGAAELACQLSLPRQVELRTALRQLDHELASVVADSLDRLAACSASPERARTAVRELSRADVRQQYDAFAVRFGAWTPLPGRV
jgi:poly-gamma-glutamate synthesis protein (capsule biosynthesis protein)